MFRPSYFTLLFTLQPITGNRCTYNMHYVCYLRIVQLFESNFKCLSWFFLYIFVCRVSWKCCPFLFISFLHSSLSMTKSLSAGPVLTYFSQRSKHFRSSFRDCLNLLRGLPGFLCPGPSTIRFHSSDGSSFVCCVCPIKVFIDVFKTVNQINIGDRISPGFSSNSPQKSELSTF